MHINDFCKTLNFLINVFMCYFYVSTKVDTPWSIYRDFTVITFGNIILINIFIKVCRKSDANMHVFH